MDEANRTDLSGRLVILLAKPLAMLLSAGDSAEDVRAEVESLSPLDEWYHYWRGLMWTMMLAGFSVGLMLSGAVEPFIPSIIGRLMSGIAMGGLFGSFAVTMLYIFRVSLCLYCGSIVSKISVLMRSGCFEWFLFVVVALLFGVNHFSYQFDVK